MKKIWTFEQCLREAKKYETKSDWRNKSRSSYVTAHRLGFFAECSKHFKSHNKNEVLWSLQMCKEQAFKYSKRSEWIRNHRISYRQARKNGWYEECCLHMGESLKTKWTKELCKQVASKYETKREWRINDTKSFYSAYKNKWMNECLKFLKPKI